MPERIVEPKLAADERGAAAITQTVLVEGSVELEVNADVSDTSVQEQIRALAFDEVCGSYGPTCTVSVGGFTPGTGRLRRLSTGRIKLTVVRDLYDPGTASEDDDDVGAGADLKQCAVLAAGRGRCHSCRESKWSNWVLSLDKTGL